MATEIPTEALDAAATATEGHSVVPERAGWYCICGETGDDRNSRGGAYRHLLTLELEAAVAVLIELGWSPPTGPHIYLSSACRHADDPGREGEDLHDECKTNMIRPDGTEKRPAECKHCGAPCICPICRHQEASGREFESGPVQVADRALIERATGGGILAQDFSVDAEQEANHG